MSEYAELQAIELDPRRAQTVGASEVPALFSTSWSEFGEEDFMPFETRFSLWHRKAGKVAPKSQKGNARTFWGQHLEPGIASGIAALTGWELARAEFTMHPSVDQMSATPDFTAAENPIAETFLLEIKNVDRLEFRKWQQREEPGVELWKDGSWEPCPFQPPMRIKLQVQQQMACCGLPRAVIGILVGGNDPYLVRMERHHGVVARLEAEVAEFWRTVREGLPPEPDFEMDCGTIADLLGMAEDDTVLDLRRSTLEGETERVFGLAMRYREYAEVESEAKKEKEKLKAELLHTVVGKYAKVLLPNRVTVSAFNVDATFIEAHMRSAYRGFRVTQSKK